MMKELAVKKKTINITLLLPVGLMWQGFFNDGCMAANKNVKCSLRSIYLKKPAVSALMLKYES